MQYLVRRYQSLFPRLPFIVRLVLNLALLPVILFWSVPRALLRINRAEHRFGAVPPTMPEMEEGQFRLDRATRDEVSRQPGALMRMRALAGADNWRGFLAQMATWDATNAQAEGDPLTYSGTRAARWSQIMFLEKYDDCSEMTSYELHWGAIEELELAFAHHHRDPRMAATLARAHEEMAWARRGGNYADAVSRQGWEGFSQHLERANEILSDFDVLAEGSFLLASVTHTVALSSEWDDAALDAAFDACLRLNPRCWTTMGERAFHLLPRWGGDYEQLELAARHAMAATSENGAAAYAAFYLAVLGEEDGPLFFCDPDLFAEGLADMAAAENGDPVLVNRLINEVIDIVAPRGSLFGGTDDDETNARRAAFSNAADKLFRDHFCCHITDVWTSDPEEVAAIAASMYAEEIEAGCRVHLTLKGGIEIGEPTAV